MRTGIWGEGENAESVEFAAVDESQPLREDDLKFRRWNREVMSTTDWKKQNESCPFADVLARHNVSFAS